MAGASTPGGRIAPAEATVPVLTGVHVWRTEVSQPLLDQVARLSDRAGDVVVPVRDMSQDAVAGIEQLVEAVRLVVSVQLTNVHPNDIPRFAARETELVTQPS